ncbi:DUF1661 domain-containing protein [Porphyromonas gingivalis]|uniref:DUF1661 domain-containing protein n=1 Tax=Porphyromonas gingivalis TaxID=837 RepID=UPI00374D9F15
MRSPDRCWVVSFVIVIGGFESVGEGSSSLPYKTTWCKFRTKAKNKAEHSRRPIRYGTLKIRLNNRYMRSILSFSSHIFVRDLRTVNEQIAACVFLKNTNQNYFVLARKFFPSRAKTKKISRHVFRGVGWNNSRA